MTSTEAHRGTLPEMLFDLARERAAVAFAQHAPILPRQCSERECWDAAWAALQDAGADYSTVAVATCQAAALPDELVRTMTLAGNDQFIRCFFELAEAWRIGGRA